MAKTAQLSILLSIALGLCHGHIVKQALEEAGQRVHGISQAVRGGLFGGLNLNFNAHAGATHSHAGILNSLNPFRNPNQGHVQNAGQHVQQTEVTGNNRPYQQPNYGQNGYGQGNQYQGSNGQTGNSYGLLNNNQYSHEQAANYQYGYNHANKYQNEYSYTHGNQPYNGNINNNQANQHPSPPTENTQLNGNNPNSQYANNYQINQGPNQIANIPQKQTESAFIQPEPTPLPNQNNNYNSNNNFGQNPIKQEGNAFTTTAPHVNNIASSTQNIPNTSHNKGTDFAHILPPFEFTTEGKDKNSMFVALNGDGYKYNGEQIAIQPPQPAKEEEEEFVLDIRSKE